MIPSTTYVNAGSMTAIGIIFPILAIVSLALRAYGWRRSPRTLEIDDVFIIPAACLNIAAGVALVIGAQLSVIGGHSYPMITPDEQVRLGKFEYAFWIGHILAIGSIKLALLFLFRRVFKGVAYTTAFDYANWTLIVLVTLWTILFLFFEIFACGATPAASWSSLESLRTACVDTFGMQTGCAVFSWVLDLAILIEPLTMIIPLNMSTRKKAQTCFVFLCSGFAVIAGLLRMIPWIQIHIQDLRNPVIKILDTNLPIADQEGIVSIVLFWTYIEIGVGFLVACLPRSAWVLDKISLDTFLSKLRSFSSVASLLKRDQYARTNDTERFKRSKSWELASQPKGSSIQHSDDDIHLVAVAGQV